MVKGGNVASIIGIEEKVGGWGSRVQCNAPTM